MHSSWTVGGELPCDVHMVNLRTMLDPPSTTGAQRLQHPAGKTTSLTLHRLGFDCGLKSQGLSCSTNGGKVRTDLPFYYLFNVLYS